MEKQPASNPEYGAPPPYSPNEQAPPPAYPAPAGSGTNYSTSYAAPGVTGPLPPINHPQQAYPAGTVVVVTQGTNFLGPDPVTMSCPKCSAQVVTNTEFENGLLTWLLCGGLAIFGCIYGCCLIPFCVDSAKNTIHSCPNCNQYIGTYRRI